MKYTTRIYDLVLNQQEPLIELLSLLGVKDPIDKIRDILDEQLFEVVECDSNQIIKIFPFLTNIINIILKSSLRY